MLTMLKINEVAETRKVVVTAIFWAADHHPYVSRGDRRPGRGRRGETERARLALCALSVLTAGQVAGRSGISRRAAVLTPH